MDFSNRNGQPAAPAAAQGRPAHPGGKKSRGKWLNIISVFLLVSSACLLAALIFTIATSDNKKEKEFVDTSKFQAVFLEGGQVYFGKVRELNKEYVTVDNIYYLRVNEQAAAEGQQQQQAQQDISLAKLGCELHGPQDLMVINRSQVTFWENLKDDSQVVAAINEFVKQNPEGQQCNTAQS